MMISITMWTPPRWTGCSIATRSPRGDADGGNAAHTEHARRWRGAGPPGIREGRRLSEHAVRAAHGAGGHHEPREAVNPARAWWRGLPHRAEVELRADGR